MRLYSFTNMYTSGIHAGIQTAHVVHDMMRKYGQRPEDAKTAVLNDWVDNHKTIIVKQAGYSKSLDNLYDELKEYSAWLELPVMKWCESVEALNGATTAVAIVVPASIYSRGPGPGTSDPEQGLAALINSYPMAV